MDSSKKDAANNQQELHALIHGKVQGVWFRAWAVDLATRLHLAGWVRNTSDNCVEILAQGEKEQITHFIKALHHGPALARVTQIDTKIGIIQEKFSIFTTKN